MPTRSVERDILENGPKPGDGFCYACGLKCLGRLPGQVYRQSCRNCGFQGVLKVEIMPDPLRQGEASWV